MASTQIARPSLQCVARASVQTPRCRTFTSSRRNGAVGGAAMKAASMGQIRRQIGKESSMQARAKKMKGADIPNDLGRFPETLIKPEGNDLPRLFSSQFKRRLEIEWRALWQKTRDFGGAIFQTKWNVRRDPLTKKRKREPLHLAERYFAARELHRELYTALANGDRTTINEIACTGLQHALGARLDRRQASNNGKEVWSIKYKGWTPTSPRTPWLLQALVPPMFKSTRIIADRMGAIPVGKDGRIRQVIVKIRSEQTLDRGDGKPPETKDIDEYVIIQKMRIDGVEDKWMIWGTTSPSTPEQIEELFRATGSEMSVWDRWANSATKV